VEPQSGGSGPLSEKAGDSSIMLLFLQHKALKAPTISITTGYFAPSAFRRCQVLAPAGGTGRFMPLAGSDVIPAKSLSVSQWSTGVTCSSLFLPLKALDSTGKTPIVHTVS